MSNILNRFNEIRLKRNKIYNEYLEHNKTVNDFVQNLSDYDNIDQKMIVLNTLMAKSTKLYEEIENLNDELTELWLSINN